MNGSSGAVRLAAALGDLTTARASMDRLERLAARSPEAGWLVQATRGFLVHAEGRSAAAAELLAAAASECPSVYEATRLRFEVAQLRSDRAEIQAAIRTFDEMGAEGAADRARVVARSLGMRPGRRHRRGNVLTGREQEVARLVAAGKTNSEVAKELYVSVRTVERHLGSTFAKLSYRSRVELAAAVSAGRLHAHDP